MRAYNQRRAIHLSKSLFETFRYSFKAQFILNLKSSRFCNGEERDTYYGRLILQSYEFCHTRGFGIILCEIIEGFLVTVVKQVLFAIDCIAKLDSHEMVGLSSYFFCT